MIRVSFIDADSQAVVGEVNLEPEQLPESFSHNTMLEMAGTDWHVVRAEPMTRVEYIASGRLRLFVRKIEKIDPKDLLFSLPTLENTLPRLCSGDTSTAYKLHEDDWRQHELVAARFEPEIAADLAEIRAVKAERVGVGFKRLHLRSRIPAPLAGVTMRLSEVVAALGGDLARRDVAIGGSLVDGGFAYVAGDGAIYGREVDGLVETLALDHADPAPLRALASTHKLRIVDWLLRA